MAKITVTKEYTVGSSYFFKCYDNYELHDIDILGILSQPLNGDFVMTISRMMY